MQQNLAGPLAKQVAHSAVLSVEVAHIGYAQLLHPARQRMLGRGRHLQVIVVLHEDVPVHRDFVLVERFPKKCQKTLAVVIVAENRLAVVPSVYDVDADAWNELS